ncbi:MAG TPA: M20/M25/M40 family metallo-hydrolase [Bryobacteraceae bacterium]|nr:M20/M25/M40 family metallo-hydrolase [Bryobacteraceae bacterium]
MALSPTLEERICSYVDSNRGRLVGIIRDLVRIPSENTPPVGAERACQEYIAAVLRNKGWEPLLYEPTEAPGLIEHPLYWPGRDYRNRPNLGARRKGSNGGRSLVLSGHIDTVPRGTQNWTRDPFSGDVEGNLLYGRGSNDMKGGVGTNLFVVEALGELVIRLAGDLVFETVVDEEFGGVNGTLAGRLMGFNADAAIISEPSFLRICAAQRGGRTAHLTFRTPPNAGVLTEGEFPAGVSDQVGYFLRELRNFAEQRRKAARKHEMYDHHTDPVPVAVTKISTGPWGTKEPVTIPDECKVEMYWQLMPGEVQEEVEREFFEWLDRVVASAPKLFVNRPKVEFPIRWMPGSSISRSEPLVTELAACATRALGKEPPIVGIEGPCDMYVFHQAFATPAVLWGARGGNTHNADEYLEIDTAVAAAKSLLLFVCRWCGVAG